MQTVIHANIILLVTIRFKRCSCLFLDVFVHSYYCVDLKPGSICWELFGTKTTKGDFTAHYWLAFRKKRPQDSPNWENCLCTRKYCSPVIFGAPALFKLYLFEKPSREILVGFLGKNFGGEGNANVIMHS